MVRAFLPDPIAPAQLERVVRPATRAPSAGHAQGVTLVVASDKAATAHYWDTTLPAARRAAFPWPGLLLAPVLVIVSVDPTAYVARYTEADKAETGLGLGVAAWPQPMWFVDGGMVAMALLYGATAEGLGACFFGVFEHEAAVREAFGVPPHVRLVGTVAVGHPDVERDHPSRSAGRPRRDDVVRFGGWG